MLNFSRWAGARRWLWWLPLGLLVMPVLLAWHHTCRVPHADTWVMVAQPWLDYSAGGSAWDSLHSAGTDSRHHAMKLFHLLVILLTDWNTRVESLVSVAFGVLAAAMALSFWRQHPAAVQEGPNTAAPAVGWEAWACAWFSVFAILSPMQWMNWVWGIQLCYTLVVAGSLAVFWAFLRPWPLGWRFVLAALALVAAIFSFINGWLAWGLGLLLLLIEAWRARPVRPVVIATVAWIALGLGCGWVYSLDWPEAKHVGEAGLLNRLLAEPGGVLLFFLQALGAPFAECWPYMQRADRVALQTQAAPVLAVAALLLLAIALWDWWRQRATRSFAAMLTWVVLTLWGLGNAAAITLGRIGKPTHYAFHSRYPAYTIWFHIGLLGLLLAAHGPRIKWLRRGWLVVVAWGALIGGLQGWRDSRRMARGADMQEAAVALRHVALEPTMIDAVRPTGGMDNVTLLDRLDQQGLLNVVTIKSEWVSEARLIKDRPHHEGELTGGTVEGSGVRLEGWALDSRSRGPAEAVAISFAAPGQPERWLGIATENTRQRKKAAALKARVLEERIGWVYEPLTGKETSFMSSQPIRISRKPLPHGPVTFRAYGFDPMSGDFSPLRGEVTLELP